jgi:hypothetical protein
MRILLAIDASAASDAATRQIKERTVATRLFRTCVARSAASVSAAGSGVDLLRDTCRSGHHRATVDRSRSRDGATHRELPRIAWVASRRRGARGRRSRRNPASREGVGPGSDRGWFPRTYRFEALDSGQRGRSRSSSRGVLGRGGARPRVAAEVALLLWRKS